MVDVLFDENYVMKDYAKELREEGREEGRASLYKKLYREGKVSKEYAANDLKISVEEFLKMVG